MNTESKFKIKMGMGGSLKIFSIQKVLKFVLTNMGMGGILESFSSNPELTVSNFPIDSDGDLNTTSLIAAELLCFSSSWWRVYFSLSFIHLVSLSMNLGNPNLLDLRTNALDFNCRFLFFLFPNFILVLVFVLKIYVFGLVELLSFLIFISITNMWIQALPWMRSLWEHYFIFLYLNVFMCLITLHISYLRKCNLIITMEHSLKSLILNTCFVTIQESNNIFLASSEAFYGIIISKSYGIYRLFWYHTQISCTWDLRSLMFLLLQQWLKGKRRSKYLFISWVYHLLNLSLMRPFEVGRCHRSQIHNF